MIKPVSYFFLLLLSYLLVLYTTNIDLTALSILLVLVFFINIGLLNFITRFVEEKNIKLTLKKEGIIALLLSISIIAFLQSGWKGTPFLYDNFDPGTMAFFILVPFIFLLKLTKDEVARITLLIFLLIPFMIFTKQESIAETAAIATYLCIGMLAFKKV